MADNTIKNKDQSLFCEISTFKKKQQGAIDKSQRNSQVLAFYRHKQCSEAKLVIEIPTLPDSFRDLHRQAEINKQ